MESIATIILAAGKGTRMKKTDGNKVVTLLHGKPLIVWAVETAHTYSSRIVVVVGAHEESVRNTLAAYPVEFVRQEEQRGTAHATEIGLRALTKNPLQYVVVGYGDHMMFYSSSVIKKFIQNHIDSSSSVSLITAHCTDPNSLAYGRIVRKTDGNVARIVEQKDATSEERAITEVNAGLYCFDYSFLTQTINTIRPSIATGEYYLTDMVEIANQMQKKVVPFVVPFEEIGYGVNSKEDLEKSHTLKKTILAH